MDALIALLIVVGALALILTALVWLARRVRRSGVGGALMGPIDEVYNPAAHRYRQVVQIQEQRAQPQAGAGSDS